MNDNTPLISKQTLWGRKLLDFSLRNNLLNTRLGRRVIPFVSFDAEYLENNLQSGTDYKLLPVFETKTEPCDDGMYNSQVQFADNKEMVSAAVKEKKLISCLSQAELAQSLKYLFRSSRTALEENGANSLFLALGLLKWFEDDKAQKARFAPLLLLPVNLVRKGAAAGYVLRLRDEEVIFNTTLTELLKQQYKVNLDFLTPLPQDEAGVDVKQVFEQVKQAVASYQRWEVREEVLLGLFSFNKFVMWNDIHSNQDKLKENPIVASLINNRLSKETISDDFADAGQMDKTMQPKDSAIPLDADSSQTEAIAEAAKGKSFVLHGPPGTGKSQTITNMIANALYHGKRVLFVAEKMAALEVVQSRLEKIGLGPFCLELHSNKVTKKHFLEQMQRALDVVKIQQPGEYERLSQEVFEKRKKLIDYTEALHNVSGNSLSLYDCICGWLKTPQKEIETSCDLSFVTKDDINTWKDEIEKLNVIFQITGYPSENPLYGLMPQNAEKKTLDDLQQRLQKFIVADSGSDKWISVFAELVPDLDLTLFAREGFTVKDIEKLTESFKNREKCRKTIMAECKQEVLNADAAELNSQWREIKNKWFAGRFFAKKKFFKTLKQYGNINEGNVEALLESLQTYADCGKTMQHYAQLQEYLHQTLNEKCKIWTENFGLMHGWFQWVNKKREFAGTVFEKALCMTESADCPPETVINGFIKGVYRNIAESLIDKNPDMRIFNGLVFDQIAEDYRKKMADFRQLTKQALYCKLASAVPSQTMAATASSEMGILKRNILNGGRGVSIRTIMDKIPNLLEKLCPCMLMSPISVAQYIDLNGGKFDTVIFDEASQMPTSEAVGAIARGKSLIVVGDPMQMPPTDFFSTNQVEETEAEADDMESILDDCISLSLPSHYLRWHYRSKHESLISFSNGQYYDNKLYTFPSADDSLAKVKLIHTDGIYDKGKTRSNINEANAVVDEIIRRLKDDKLSKYSIGVVSFSKVQQDLIEDVLNERLAKHPELEDKAYNRDEPIFIKNLENVQGDERDVILFSVGYGPDKEGKVSMNFGPLNNSGGERRLNVAVSRSRYEMYVYSSLNPEDIDLKRSSAKGVEGLKKFLEFARNSTLPQQQTENNKQSEDTVACLIAKELQNHGYQTVFNVGRSDFKVNLAVCDKSGSGKYVLAILTDGEIYRKTKTVEDRQTVQTGCLKRLGWEVMRIWTVDWYRNKDAVIKRILDKLESISSAEENLSDKTEESSGGYKFSLEDLQKQNAVAEHENVAMQPSLEGKTKRNIADIPLKEIKDAAEYVLKEQISLPKEDLKRLTAKVLGFARTGARIDTVTEQVIEMMLQENRICERNGNLIISPE